MSTACLLVFPLPFFPAKSIPKHGVERMYGVVWLERMDRHRHTMRILVGFLAFLYKKIRSGSSGKSSVLAWLCSPHVSFLHWLLVSFCFPAWWFISVMFLCKDTQRQSDFSTVKSWQSSRKESTLEEFYICLVEECYEWHIISQKEQSHLCMGPTCLCAKYTWELPRGSANSTKTQVGPISSGKNEHLTTQAMQVCTN